MAHNTELELHLIDFLKDLRERIIAKFETLEEKQRFQRTPWNYHAGTGGGEIGLLRGDVFEKGAVNFSAIHGDKFPMSDSSGAFFATGISLITHMHNPYAATVHMNIRYIRTEAKTWLGGGYDLTPMGFPQQEDTEHFHGVAKMTLDRTDKKLYPQFSQQAKEYFYIPHRKKERGVGGIFFDHYATGNLDEDLKMWKGVGNTFLDAIFPLYEKRVNTPYTPEEKEMQLLMRSHYVEYNLLYDRGTKFGFQSGGNPDAILCSMPPVCKW
jgi:coproporphyrinogen III oxidase